MPNESLYDRKPEESAPAATSLVNSSTVHVSSSSSRFEYVESISAEISSAGPQVIGHVSPPTSLNFFGEFGMESGSQKKHSSSSSKVQVSSKKVMKHVKNFQTQNQFLQRNFSVIRTKPITMKLRSHCRISCADLFGYHSDDS
ncbi:hypothetical protein DsansV1_C03g0029561 [Dioscorea sansibarensis]